MNLRDEQYLRRKQQIKDTALDLFVSNNLEGTTTRSIASNANISSGLLFHYYDSKESLYYEIFADAIELVEPLFAPNPLHSTPLAILENLTNNVLKLMENENSAKHFLLIVNTLFRVQNDKFVEEKCVQLRLQVSSFRYIIALGQQLNEFKEGDPSTYLYLYLSSLHGCAICKIFKKVNLPSSEMLLRFIRNN